MANISKIALNGTSYDVKDTQARGNITTINGNISTIQNDITNIKSNVGNLGNVIGIRGWNQLVSNSTTSVLLKLGKKYFTRINGVETIVTGTGNSISVTGGTDNVINLTEIFGAGNEPTTVAKFREMFPNTYYPHYIFNNISSTAEFISSTSLAYTGISYTIPAKSKYCLDFSIIFYNSTPLEIMLSSSSTGSDFYNRFIYSKDSPHAYISGYANNNVTIYIWAKYGASATNQLAIYGYTETA